MSNDRAALGYALGFLGVVIFGLTLPATVYVLPSFDPWFLTAARATIAGLCGLILLLATRRPLPRGHLSRLVAAALCVSFGFPAFSAMAMQTVPASHGGVVLAILPLATAIAATLVAGERPSRRFWCWSVAGAAVVLAFAIQQGDGTVQIADLWLLAGGVSAALGYALFGSLARAMPGWEQISWAVVLILPISLLATVLLWQPAYALAPAPHWLMLGYIGMFSMYLGFFAWNAGLAIGGIAKVGQIQLLQTFVTISAAVLFLGEKMDLTTLIFAVITVGIVAMARRAPVARRIAE